MNHLLEVAGAAFAYEPGRIVLDGVNAAARSGAMTGIVGPNGSGKSTLLRLLCGLLHPQAGGVHLDGENLRSFRGRARARLLGFLPQAVSPVFSLSVFEVVCLGRYPHSGALGALRPQDFEVVRRCLADTGTEDLCDRPFLSLSGGERQRVLLAGILAQEPALLLLDEPTSALDIHHEVEVFALMRRLADDGYGVVAVTHDLNLAAQYCDALVLLSQEHRVLSDGSPAEVLTADRLSEAYGAAIRVGEHPFTGAPFIAAEQERRS